MSRMMELYLHSSVLLHGVVLNSLNAGTTLLCLLGAMLRVLTVKYALSVEMMTTDDRETIVGSSICMQN
jgi:hypothetical protein